MAFRQEHRAQVRSYTGLSRNAFAKCISTSDANRSAQWQTRCIHHVAALNVDQVIGANAVRGASVHHAIQLPRVAPSTRTSPSVGVDNIGNKMAPLAYRFDTSTYDTPGRYYHAQVIVDY